MDKKIGISESLRITLHQTSFFSYPWFGKSLFVSVLNYYYDINEKDNFHALFNGTEIGNEPTAKQSSYYILNFDFSTIPTETEEELQAGISSRV